MKTQHEKEKKPGKTVAFNLRMEEGLYNSLCGMSERTGIPAAEIIRRSVRSMLAAMSAERPAKEWTDSAGAGKGRRR